MLSLAWFLLLISSFLFQVGNTELYGHRAVLASVSSKLMELFSEDDDEKTSFPESHTVHITLKLNPDFESKILEKMIDYAYTARWEISNNFTFHREKEEFFL